ncbi:MAG: SDR family NAD(P)-dependent oxidoreductase [Spirochaetes bacterium]|nr:SDR family NAD(P)-dependent oxidoreductase [Spirochaetota bacterium]
MKRLFRYLLRYRAGEMVQFLRNERRGPKACDADLKEKTVVLSGATSGIGLETARLFASRRARLILLNRDPAKSAALEAELRKAFAAEVRTVGVDFSSLQSVRECARQLLELADPIDVLIHNAGVYHTELTMTQDGIETVFQVNHLAPFLLNHLLMPRLKRENRARILHVNSEGHRFALTGVHTEDLAYRNHRYTGLKSYGAAKTAQLLTLQRFRDAFADGAVTVNAMHPGNVVSNIGNQNGPAYRAMKERWILPSAKDPGISAQALLYLAASPDLEGVSGKFFNLTAEEIPAPHARDLSAIGPVWNASLALCGLA